MRFYFLLFTLTFILAVDIEKECDESEYPVSLQGQSSNGPMSKTELKPAELAQKEENNIDMFPAKGPQQIEGKTVAASQSGSKGVVNSQTGEKKDYQNTNLLPNTVEDDDECPIEDNTEVDKKTAAKLEAVNTEVDKKTAPKPEAAINSGDNNMFGGIKRKGETSYPAINDDDVQPCPEEYEDTSPVKQSSPRTQQVINPQSTVTQQVEEPQSPVTQQVISPQSKPSSGVVEAPEPSEDDCEKWVCESDSCKDDQETQEGQREKRETVEYQPQPIVQPKSPPKDANIKPAQPQPNSPTPAQQPAQIIQEKPQPIPAQEKSEPIPAQEIPQPIPAQDNPSSRPEDTRKDDCTCDCPPDGITFAAFKIRYKQIYEAMLKEIKPQSEPSEITAEVKKRDETEKLTTGAVESTKEKGTDGYDINTLSDSGAAKHYSSAILLGAIIVGIVW